MIGRRILTRILLVPLALGLFLAPAAAQDVSVAKQVVERVLPNGLKVLIVQRPELPTVRCILAFRVGSVNERPGITGISHMHEHMMFKGTYTMGIKPGTLEKDLEFNRQIDALEEEIAAEEAKVRGRDEAKIIGLKKQASEILAKQRGETIVPSGAAAANALGLTTQVPVKSVYLTSGRSRVLNLGRQAVELRPRATRGITGARRVASWARAG